MRPRHFVITSYSIHYTKLYDNLAAQIDDPFDIFRHLGYLCDMLQADDLCDILNLYAVYFLTEIKR